MANSWFNWTMVGPTTFCMVQLNRNHSKCCGPTLVAMATKFGLGAEIQSPTGLFGYFSVWSISPSPLLNQSTSHHITHNHNLTHCHSSHYPWMLSFYCLHAPCLRKNFAQLFLLQLSQSSTNCENFWHSVHLAGANGPDLMLKLTSCHGPDRQSSWARFGPRARLCQLLIYDIISAVRKS